MALKAGRVGVHPNDVDMLGHIISGGSGGGAYSEDEQIVGTWVDGRPVYAKTIINTSASRDLEIPPEIEDLDYFIDISGICCISNGGNFPLNSPVYQDLRVTCIYNDAGVLASNSSWDRVRTIINLKYVKG